MKFKGQGKINICGFEYKKNIADSRRGGGVRAPKKNLYPRLACIYAVDPYTSHMGHTDVCLDSIGSKGCIGPLGGGPCAWMYPVCDGHKNYIFR